MKQSRRAGRPAAPLQREHMLAVALGVFAEHGYAGATIARIAERLGVSKPTVIHHFKSKDALYTEVFAEALGSLAEIVAALDPRAPFLTQLDALSEATGRHLAQRPEAARLLVHEIVGQGNALPEELREGVGGVVRGLAIFLAAAMERGELPRDDPGQLAMSLIGLHFLYWAAPVVAEAATPGASIEARIEAARRHARGVCGVGR